MTYHTPQSGVGREGGISLLFTPATLHARDKADGGKATPGEFRTMSSFGRSPSGQHRAFAGSGRKEPTSMRRRSLTPASQPKDTPPPPPADSLLDSPGGLGGLPWGQPRPEDEGAGVPEGHLGSG